MQLKKFQSLSRANFNEHDCFVIIGDAKLALQRMQDDLVDLVVTSPPYWGQRDYQESHQLGNETTSQEYIDKLMAIHTELKRVIKDTGVYFLNIGDKYLKKGLELIPERIAYEMKQTGWVLRNKVIWYKSNPNPSPVKDRFSNAYEVIYMFVKNPENYLTPEYYFDLDSVRETSLSDNTTKKEELPRYIELDELEKYTDLIKQREYNGKFKDQTAINRGASAGGRLSIQGEYYSRQRKHPIPRSLKLQIVQYLRAKRLECGLSINAIDRHFNTPYTAGHWFRTDRGGYSLPSPTQWQELKRLFGIGKTTFDDVMTEEHFVLQTVRPHARGKNPSDVWKLPTASLKEKHFAPFPESIPERCIKACCPSNGIVLDPFLGSGTTLKVANRLNRKSIGIEINPAYLEIIEQVTGATVAAFTS